MFDVIPVPPVPIQRSLKVMGNPILASVHQFGSIRFKYPGVHRHLSNSNLFLYPGDCV